MLMKELVEINKEMCKLLWTMPSFSSKSLPLTSSRLIFPPLSNSEIRRSEQEARFAFASVIERSTKYFYSVETPTMELYNFTGQKTDLTLYTFENKFVEQARVEFKAKNPPQEHITKDIEKLVREKTTGNWFHLLENIDSSTLGSLFDKFKIAFNEVNSRLSENNQILFNGPILFFFVVIDKRWAIYKWFNPQGDIKTYCNDFFYIGYSIRQGEIIISDLNGWEKYKA